jgi:hypothetical protein
LGLILIFELELELDFGIWNLKYWNFIFLGIPTRVGLSALAFYKKLLVVFYKRAQTMLLSLMQDLFSVEIKS